jgi:hypothetical protein
MGAAKFELSACFVAYDGWVLTLDPHVREIQYEPLDSLSLITADGWKGLLTIDTPIPVGRRYAQLYASIISGGEYVSRYGFRDVEVRLEFQSVEMGRCQIGFVARRRFVI